MSSIQRYTFKKQNTTMTYLFYLVITLLQEIARQVMIQNIYESSCKIDERTT